MNGITADDVRKRFNYDPETGVLSYRVPCGRNGRYKAGQEAGWIDKSNGYRYVEVSGFKIKAHRLIWLYVHGGWPSCDLDHQNRNPADNRLDNIRPATDGQNACNRAFVGRNKTGHRNISFRSKQTRKPWDVSIGLNGKNHWIGCYATIEEAIEVRNKTAVKMHADFAVLEDVPVHDGFTTRFGVGRLLLENLTPKQREQYETHKHFDVKGNVSGKTYRIKHGRQMNIEELDKNGKRVRGLCFLPNSSHGALVAGDCMLAQKIALETDETATLKIANKF